MNNTIKNVKGFSLTDEIIIIVVLALALLVAVILINRNFTSVETLPDEITKEETVVNSAKEYVSDFYGTIKKGDELIISIDNIIDEGYLDEKEFEMCSFEIQVINGDFKVNGNCD